MVWQSGPQVITGIKNQMVLHQEYIQRPARKSSNLNSAILKRLTETLAQTIQLPFTGLTVNGIQRIYYIKI